MVWGVRNGKGSFEVETELGVLLVKGVVVHHCWSKLDIHQLCLINWNRVGFSAMRGKREWVCKVLCLKRGGL
jgi:hypothetical protein